MNSRNFPLNRARILSFVVGLLCCAFYGAEVASAQLISTKDSVNVVGFLGHVTYEPIYVMNLVNVPTVLHAVIEPQDSTFVLFTDSILIAAKGTGSFYVNFAPASIGLTIDTLLILDSNFGVAARVLLTGNGIVEQYFRPTTHDDLVSVVKGDTACAIFTLVNPYPANSITLIRAEVSSQRGYSLDSSMLHCPTTLAPGDSASVRVCTTSNTDTVFWDSVAFVYYDANGVETYAAAGLHTLFHDAGTLDTASLSLMDNNQHVFFDLTSPSPNAFVLRVQNTTGGRVRIEDMSQPSSRKFAAAIISPDSSLPFILQQDSVMLILITLTDTSIGTYFDSLYLYSQNALTSTKIYLGAARAIASVASNSFGASPTLEINPNPATGVVHVVLGEAISATIDVMDVLGRIVTHAVVRGTTWDWHGTNTSGAEVPAGAYIVRAQVVSAKGESSTMSSKVMFTR